MTKSNEAMEVMTKTTDAIARIGLESETRCPIIIATGVLMSALRSFYIAGRLYNAKEELLLTQVNQLATKIFEIAEMEMQKMRRDA